MIEAAWNMIYDGGRYANSHRWTMEINMCRCHDGHKLLC